MLNLISVFFGGGIGASLRYLIGMFFVKNVQCAPYLVTFIINAIGCFILGFLYILFITKHEYTLATKLSLTVGFCGSLTTFSTFSMELFDLIRTSQYTHACLYVLFSVIVGLIAVILGTYAAKLCI